MSGQEVNSDETKPIAVPLGIALLRRYVADKLPSRCVDAYIVATVIAELQDYCIGRAVGFYIGQLADRCGMGCKNPRRLRVALKFLADNGYLEMTVPAAGSRQQTLFKLSTPGEIKTDPRQSDGNEQSTPTQNGSDSQTTPNQSDGGEGLTPVKTVARPPSERYGDPRQNGSTSNPVLSNPVYSIPNTKNPLNPPEGKMVDSVDSFRLEAVQEIGKPTKGARKTRQANTDEVSRLYAAYPRKAEPVAAKAAIVKALGRIPFSELLPKVESFAAAVRESGVELRFVKNPATWFNKGCWDDDPASWPQKPTATQFGKGRPSLAGGSGQTYDPEAAIKDPNYGKF